MTSQEAPTAGGPLGVPDGPVLRTAVPGPRSRRLLERQEARESAVRSYPRRLPIALRRGRGAYVEDEDGNLLIDFLCGAGALPLGHSHPELVAAATRQAPLLSHGLDFPSAAKDDFTDGLLSLFPARMRDRLRVQFCGPTGANAVEAALKLCKTATGRGEVVAFHGGFHGMTHAAMAVSGGAGVRRQVANTMPGVHFFPYSYCLRCPMGLTPQTCTTNCIGYLEKVLADSHGGLNTPAAVLVELVQGEGGGIPATADFVRRLRALTADHGIPLVVDEVQTGVGRTGEWFAFETYGIEPDVVVLSKMLSGIGTPLAVVVCDAALDVWEPGAHTGTFRGNQLGFAAGAEAFRVMRRDGVLENVRRRGEEARVRLGALASAYPGAIAEARTAGLMLAVEFARPPSGAPWPEMAAAVQRRALERGLIVEAGGRRDAVVRMLPPLDVDPATLTTALSILEEAVGAALADLPTTTETV